MYEVCALDILEERLADVDWWIPGLREFNGIPLMLWCVLISATIAFGPRDMYRLWRARSRNEIGPQEYRWRSGERGQYTGRVALAGCALVPMIFAIMTLIGLFGVALAFSDDIGWNLFILSATIFWFFAYRWLFQRWRSGFHEPVPPDFGDDRRDEPIILRVAAGTQDRR